MVNLKRLKKLAFGLRTRRTRHALYRGVGAAIEHRRILEAVRPRRIVDVGANRGQFSLLASTLDPQVEIDSFEPLPSAADVFEEIFRNHPRVRLHRFAIGSIEGTASMHVSRRDDSSSLLPIGDEQVAAFPGTEAISTTAVMVRPLSALGLGSLKDALLKIDVQGFELSVLQGCGRLLESFSHVYVEASLRELYQGQALFGQVHAFLQDSGFELVDVGELVRDDTGAMLQGDFLFAARATIGRQ